MAITAALPPTPIAILSGFDYVAVDAARRRIYAAHTGSQALMIVDADSGKALGQVRVGPLHGVAVDPANGHVYTGDGEADSVSEIDPVAMTVVRSTDVAGHVDAVAYDPANHHIYADEDDGTHIYVLDSNTMKSVGTVDLPGHKPEYLAIDPASHALYQNITDLGEVAVIDPATLKVTRTIATPQIKGNHPLQFDPAYGHLLVGGQNGTVAVYTTDGTFVGSAGVQPRVDQCDLDRTHHVLACAGSGKLTFVRDEPAGAPVAIGATDIAREAHTVAIDPKTGYAWIVWPQPSGDFTQPYKIAN